MPVVCKMEMCDFLNKKIREMPLIEFNKPIGMLILIQLNSLENIHFADITSTL